MRFVKVVYFDAAGTLFRVRGSVGEIYADVARGFGIRVDPEALQRSFVSAFRASTARGFPDERNLDLGRAEREWWMNVVRQAFGADMPEQTLPAYFDRVFELFRGASAWELYPDSRPTLRDLHLRGYRLGVISNFDSRLHDVLANLGIVSHFEQVCISWQIGISKPAPGIFRHALDAMGISASEAVHIGDSPDEDVAGALAAGMHAILLDRAGGRDVPRGSMKMRSLAELCSFLTG